MEHQYPDCPTQTSSSWPSLDVAARCVSANGCRGRARADLRRGLGQRRSLRCGRRAASIKGLEQSDVVNRLSLDVPGQNQSEQIGDRVAIHNHSSPEEAKAEIKPKPKRTVVLSLDYDGCMDVLFEGTDLRLRKRHMTKELEVMDEVRNILHQDLQRITAGADRVILMVGSNRQSIYVDTFNRKSLEMEIGQLRNEIGLVRHDFQKLAEQKGWELNRALLADKENNVPPGTAWNNGDLRFTFGRGMDKEVKKSLIQYQFEQLHDLEGNIDFYFFDDKLEYLDYVRRQVAVPPSTHFFTVHFDWFSHIIEQKPMDLHTVDTEDRPQSFDARRS